MPRWLGPVSVGALALGVAAGLVHSPGRPQAATVRAAYFYNYMPASHLDSLAQVGVNRAVIHWITDSLGTRGSAELHAFAARGVAAGVEVVPQWALQARARLTGLGSSRRYTWGSGTVEVDVACPLDSLYWRSALLDRTEEVLAVAPGSRRLAVDLELYSGSRHHYDAGPCRCPRCLAEYGGARAADPGRDPRRLRGLLSWEEARLNRILTSLLSEFAARHPGVELGVFDLDLDSFVHRAFARALARTGVPAADYCERSYPAAPATLSGARARLDALGLPDASLVGGLWLKRAAPADLPNVVRSIEARAGGYFLFTTYSLWQDPARLTGPYTLAGTPADYWRAIREVNATP